MEDISMFFAFMAGVLSFFSPCVLPLLPVYLANLTGAVIDKDKMQVSRLLVGVRSLGFISGFSTVFIIMGASATILGEFIIENRSILEKVGGLLIILFGLQEMGLLQFKLLARSKQWDIPGAGKRNFLSSVVMGLAFGTGWTPCVGLVLSSILVLAGTLSTVYQGACMLFIYSLGLGLPFFLLSLALTYSLARVRDLNRYLGRISFCSGGILVIMGVLLLLGRFSALSAWFVRLNG